MATGRTVSKWVRVVIGDTGNVLRQIPVDSINNLGLPFDEVSYAAFMDAAKGVLVNLPSFSITITGPFDTTAAAAYPNLSGSHTILSALNGGSTPRTLDIQFGIGAAYTAGVDQQFGISQSGASGILVTDYQVIPSANGEVKYSAKISLNSGSAVPAWGNASEV